jgi:hypothetical protein
MKSAYRTAAKEAVHGFKGVPLHETIADPYNYTGDSTGNEHFALGVIANGDECFIEICVGATFDGGPCGDRNVADTFYAGPFVSDETACEAMEKIACDLEGTQF